MHRDWLLMGLVGALVRILSASKLLVARDHLNYRGLCDDDRLDLLSYLWLGPQWHRRRLLLDAKTLRIQYHLVLEL
jgi:hypothetical protein